MGMILVDNQGSFKHVYSQLDEGIWDGMRFCNVIFPWFLFIMGTAIPLSLKPSDKRNKLGTLQRFLSFFSLVSDHQTSVITHSHRTRSQLL